MPFPTSSFVQNGTFTRVQEIGQGAGTVVYQAYYSPRNRSVAIKAVAPGRPDTTQIQLRLAREFQIAKPLRHPHIIGVHALVNDTSQAESYLICDFADGGSLSDLLAQQGRLSETAALDYTLDICAALEDLEQRKIVHRDLKPSNILLVSDGQGALTAKLADFGAAQDQISQTRTAMKGDKHPGTPQYMAPEQNDVTNPVDIRADIFALGATLWEMLAGTPFKRPGNKKRPALRKLNPQTSPGVAAVIARATAHDPDQRYRTPKEFAEDLRAVQARRMPAAMRQTISRRVGGSLLAMVLVAALGVGGLGLMNANAARIQAAAMQAVTATWLAGQATHVGTERTALARTSIAIAVEATASANAAWATGTALAATVGAENAASTATAVAETQTALAHQAETASAIAAEQTAFAHQTETASAIMAAQNEADRAATMTAEARRQAADRAATMTAEARRQAADRAATMTAEAKAAEARRQEEELARSVRRITLVGDIYIEDDETFGSNEKGSFAIAYNEEIVVSPDAPTYNTQAFSKCVGGEVRVELYLTAQLQPDHRSVEVSTRALLFEGTSCNTNKLRREESLTAIVGESATVNYFIPVYAPAGDFSKLNFDVTNNQR